MLRNKQQLILFIGILLLAECGFAQATEKPVWKDESAAVEKPTGTTVAKLNGTEYEFDNCTGSLLRLTHPQAGDIIKTDVNHASLIDMACPTATYNPLRVASRFSKNARILAEPNRIVIIWDELGNSYQKFEKVEGKVRARVDIVAMKDGRSVELTATVDNQSKQRIPQILFPDFMGLRAIGGSEHTYLRLIQKKMRPFIDIGRQQYCTLDHTGDNYWNTNFWGAHNDASCGRWFDWGWNKGGLSGYQRQWGYGTPVCKVWVVKDELTPDRMRMFLENQVQSPNGDDKANPFVVDPNQIWQSPPFILTPHSAGWPKGIEPYREWVQSHPWLKIARHIKEDLAYRSIWMSEAAEFRPGEPCYFRYTDLPALARESKEHGMHEMVVWVGLQWGALPYRTLAHLGTEEELAKAVAECKAMGVDVSHFLEAILLIEESLKQFDIKPTWIFGSHTSMFPTVPYYSDYIKVALIPSWNEKWQKACLKSIKEDILDKGLGTSAWTDSYNYKKPPAGVNYDYHTFARSVRELCREKNPDAAYGSETIDNIEDDCGNIDVTWVWTPPNLYMTPTNSVFKSPRFAINVEDGYAYWVPRLFIDNTMINVMPRDKAGKLNAAGWLKDDPKLCAALNQCDKLRKQFLPYFTDGINLGDGVTDGVYEDLYIGAYQLPDSLLVLLLNDKPRELKDIPLGINLKDWLGGKSFTVQVFDGQGQPIGQAKPADAKWQTKLERMMPDEIRILEFHHVAK